MNNIQDLRKNVPIKAKTDAKTAGKPFSTSGVRPSGERQGRRESQAQCTGEYMSISRRFLTQSGAFCVSPKKGFA